MCNEYIATSKPLLKRNAAMLSGLSLEELDEIAPKEPRVEDSEGQMKDASELCGDDCDDIQQLDDQIEETKESEKSIPSCEGENSSCMMILKW